MDCRPTKPLLQLQENHVGAMSIEQQPICYLRSLVLQGEGEVNAALGCSEVNKDLASRHPSKLPPCFVAAGLQLVPPKTNKTSETPSENTNPHGQWKKQERFAIRGAGAMESRCRYIGVKTILNFEPHAGIGKKRDTVKDRWIMIQYQNLREEGEEFVIEKEILCKVLFGQKGKGNLLEYCIVPVCPASVVHFGAATQLAPPHPAPSTNLGDIKKLLDSSDFEEQLACNSGEECLMELDDMYNGFEKALNGSQDPIRMLETSRIVDVQEEDAMECFQDLYEECRMSSGCEEQLTPSESGDDARSRAAGAKSKVWDYFTRIFQKQINKKDQLLYAACRKCHQVLMAESQRHGTSRLLKHHEAHAKEEQSRQ